MSFVEFHSIKYFHFKVCPIKSDTGSPMKFPRCQTAVDVLCSVESQVQYYYLVTIRPPPMRRVLMSGNHRVACMDTYHVLPSMRFGGVRNSSLRKTLM